MSRLFLPIANALSSFDIHSSPSYSADTVFCLIILTSCSAPCSVFTEISFVPCFTFSLSVLLLVFYPVSVSCDALSSFDIHSFPSYSADTVFCLIPTSCSAPCSVFASLTEISFVPCFTFSLSVLLLVFYPVSVSCGSGESQISGLRRL